LSTFLAVAHYETAARKVLAKSDACLFVMAQLGWPWSLMGIFRVLPRALRDPLYDLVARNRYRIFGRRERCLVPAPEVRHRFVDR
jgi:predicted DCC family thiol-disulfide oxidoreductase YuxK